MDTQLISIADLIVSPLNVRKTLSGLDELAETVKEQGLLQPLIVRRHKHDAATFEIAAGQRRFHAAGKAGLNEVPCVVRDLTDDELVEVSLVENLQRKDASPLEEADAIEGLVARGYRTDKQLAAKLGKPVRWVERRRGLLNLSQESRTWCEARGLGAEHMEPLSVVDHDTQREAIARLGDRDMPTARVWAQEIATSLRLLAHAPFKLTDKTLGGHGPCEGCWLRSDRQADLFADVKSSNAYCLDASCWTTKSDALWAEAQKAPGRRSLKVLEGDVFWPTRPGSTPILRHDEKTADLQVEPPTEGAKPVALARTTYGAVVELYRVPTDAEIDAVMRDDEDHDSTEPDARRVERERQVAERAAERRTRGLALLRVLGTPRGRELAMRSALGVSILEAGDDAPRFALDLLGLGHLDCDDKTLPEVVPAEHLEAVLLFAMTEAVIANGEAEDPYDVALCALVATPMVRVWIAEGEWDGLSQEGRDELTDLGAGVKVEWEGRAGWVTALIEEGTLGAVVKAASRSKVKLYMGDEQPVPPTTFSVREYDWRRHRTHLLDAHGLARFKAWRKEDGRRVTALRFGSDEHKTIVDYCRANGISLLMDGREVAGSIFVQPKPPKARAAKASKPTPDVEEEPEVDEEEEDESEEEEEFDDDDELVRHTRDGEVVFDRSAEVDRG